MRRFRVERIDRWVIQQESDDSRQKIKIARKDVRNWLIHVFSTANLEARSKNTKTNNNQVKQPENSQSNGFFITSVESANHKENINYNQQSAPNQPEKEKPLLENINKNTKYENFSKKSKKTKAQKKSRLIYSNGKLTRVQNSQSKIRTTYKLPSVMKGRHKTSQDFMSTNGGTRNSGMSNLGSRTSRNQYCKLLITSLS